MSDIVLIHGLWMSHTAWQPWIDHFGVNGLHAIAPRWPGEGGTAEASRKSAQAQGGFGIAQVTAHFAAVIEQFETPPVAIGHSVGGLVTQKLLGENKIAAAVAIAPLPMKGATVLPFVRVCSTHRLFGNPLNIGRAKGLTRRQFRCVFGNAVPQTECDRLWEQWAVPSPVRPLFEISVANVVPDSPTEVDTAITTRGPLLITAGTADRMAPFGTVRASFRRYAPSKAVTDFHRFYAAGHSLTVDHRWREVADVTLAWLADHKLVA